MCEETKSIKLCSCPENLDLTKSKNDSDYVWLLDRVVGPDTSGMIGLAMLPEEQLDELTAEFIVQELNAKNLFDFDYSPQENDQLRIERIVKKKPKKRSYYGEYLDFNYFNGQWEIGSVLPFSYHLETFKKGVVELVKTEEPEQ